MDEAAFARAAAEATVFGRITPAQKEHLVRCLQAQGHYVAMIGDGVNDVLSLKRAQLGIAMQSGSQATRSVADIVLLDDSFAILPAAVQEGRRIISGMQDVMRLVLTHTFYIVLIIVCAAIAEVAFPTTPKLRSLITLLSVGIPTMAIAAWARPDPPPGSVLRSVLHFVAPAAFTVGAVSFAVYLLYLLQTGDLGLAQSALSTVALLCGLVLVVFVEPPSPAWVAGDDLSGDWRPAGVALAMLGLYGAAMYVPPVRDFYGLAPLPMPDLLLLAGVTGAWALVVRTVWRTRLFERLLRQGRRAQRAGG
jgi:cation-transporting ATPase E